jgi:hypothetical protein
VEKYGIARQNTADNIIRRMRCACWRTKATSTQQQWSFSNVPSNVLCLFFYNLPRYVHFFCFYASCSGGQGWILFYKYKVPKYHKKNASWLNPNQIVSLFSLKKTNSQNGIEKFINDFVTAKCREGRIFFKIRPQVRGYFDTQYVLVFRVENCMCFFRDIQMSFLW